MRRLLLIGLLVASVAPTARSASLLNGPIYFVGSRAPDFAPEIYSVGPDGSGRTDLSGNSATDELPAVSPDGSQIAFVSDRDGAEELYVMNADGSDQHRVCPQPSQPAGPCVSDSGGKPEIRDLVWSPSGRTLAFTAWFPETDMCYFPAPRNYLLDLAGGQPRQLDHGLLGPVRFSPDGRFAALTARRCQDVPPQVVVIRTDTGVPVGYVTGFLVAWAPRGQRLLYEQGKPNSGGEQPGVLTTVDPFGRHRWTQKMLASAAVWSPSGRRIAFFREDSPRRGLYVVHDRRHDARRLLRFPHRVSLSAWSPNGAWIAFAGRSGAYFVRSKGARLHKVSGVPSLSTYSPLPWSPDSGHFALVDSQGIVRVLSPPQRSAVAVTTAAGDLDVCRLAWLPVCQIAWAGDRLLFASHAPPTTHLFGIEPDGSGLRQVAPDSAPLGQISPDGSRVAFVRGGIWTARLDGSDEQQVTSGFLPDSSPTWSPDGARIAFLRNTSFPRFDLWQIFTVGASGGPVQQVTQQMFSGPQHLAWSPDGAWILSGGLLVHPDGSGLHSLEWPDSCECAPYGWSPDATKLVLGGNEVAVMSVDGSGFRLLTEPSAGGAYGPSWSPDGTKIVFFRWNDWTSPSDPSTDSDLWTINADGSGETRLTSGPWHDTLPTWLPAP